MEYGGFRVPKHNLRTVLECVASRNDYFLALRGRYEHDDFVCSLTCYQHNQWAGKHFSALRSALEGVLHEPSRKEKKDIQKMANGRLCIATLERIPITYDVITDLLEYVAMKDVTLKTLEEDEDCHLATLHTQLPNGIEQLTTATDICLRSFE